MNMNEEWKDIKEVDGDYQISNLGRIRRAKACIGKGSKTTHIGKILKTEINPNGYEIWQLKHRGLRFRVHRLVADRFIPNPENKPHVNHKDGNKQNNSVNNLEWSTMEENNNHYTSLIIFNFLKDLDDKEYYLKQDLLKLLPVGEGKEIPCTSRQQTIP